MAIGRMESELPRCKMAFSLINKCWHKFEDNANQYYADALSSGDTSLMFENFIHDILLNDTIHIKRVASVKFQFNVILKYIREHIVQSNAKCANNPMVTQLFALAKKLL
jgi:hypothetical protein